MWWDQRRECRGELVTEVEMWASALQVVGVGKTHNHSCTAGQPMARGGAQTGSAGSRLQAAWNYLPEQGLGPGRGTHGATGVNLGCEVCTATVHSYPEWVGDSCINLQGMAFIPRDGLAWPHFIL